MTSHKELVLNRHLVKDDPAEDLLFGFKKFVEQITSVLEDNNTETPFVIAVHGEWGSGKTSLIKAVKKKLDSKIQQGNWKTLEFDAWEYERMDIVTALLHKILDVYGNNAKSLVKSIGSFALDAALRKSIGMSKCEVKEHFQEFTRQISTIREDLEKITKGGRLIVFVDDLDRCNVDNVLDMLEAIKMFLTARGVIFVIAADMEKIERAWQLRYNNKEGLEEGRRHIDKIFQLKLSLPPKDASQIEAFVHKIVPNNLISVERDFIIHGCPPNPRKIKRILNLEYFILKGLLEDQDFDAMVPLVVVWCILTTSFIDLAQIIEDDPDSLLRMSLICSNHSSFAALNNFWPKMKKDIENHTLIQIDQSNLSNSFINNTTRQGLEYIIEKNHDDAFNLLQNIASYYEINYQSLTEAVPEHNGIRITPLLRKIIVDGGMTGI